MIMIIIIIIIIIIDIIIIIRKWAVAEKAMNHSWSLELSYYNDTPVAYKYAVGFTKVKITTFIYM